MTTAAAAPSPRVLLLVEDDPDHAFLVRRSLAAGSLGLPVVHLRTVGAAATRLAAGDVACVLLDLALPDADGLGALHALRAVAPGVPLVVLTGLDSDEAGLQALQGGAQDYLVKGRHDGDAIVRAVLFAVERSRRRLAEERQAHLGDELRLREAQLSEAQELARLGSWEWEVPTGRVRWSAELTRLTGLTGSGCTDVFAAYLDRVGPEDRDPVARLFDVGPGPGPLLVQHRLRLPDGSLRWLQGRRTVADRDPDGTPRRVLGTMQDVTDHKRAEDRLAHQALHDDLTGLVNRGALLDRLRRVLASPDRDGSLVAVVFLDLDHFKWVNDSHSHATGDRLLVDVARRLEEVLRPTDTLARFGGDEFVVLCEAVPADGVAAVVERLERALSMPVRADPALQGVQVTASIGIATARAGTGVQAEVLVRDADIAMYSAKARGRARHAVFDADMAERASARLRTHSDLVEGLGGAQVETWFQPVVDLLTGEPVGAEALARWRHPTRGLLLPAEFVPHAEESGLVVPLGSAVLHEACRVVADWNAGRTRPLWVAVNLSARQLTEPGLVDDVRAALERSGLPAGLLCLEVTETAVVRDAAASAHVLGRLRQLGVRISVDDFGTGWSSLAYLLSLPVDELKVDRSFVAAVGSDGRGVAIVTAVLALASALGLGVVAEGIETAEQHRVLDGLGVRTGQGWLWGAAVPAGQASWAREPAGTPDPAGTRESGGTREPARGPVPAAAPRRTGVASPRAVAGRVPEAVPAPPLPPVPVARDHREGRGSRDACGRSG